MDMVKLLTALLLSGIAWAQSADVAPDPIEQPEDNRVFGVVPATMPWRPRSPFPPPLSAGGRPKIAAEDSFDPYTWVITGLYAGAEQEWNRRDKEFGQGAAGKQRSSMG